ncbi:nuclear protein MDM1 isoform X2 [Protopterus annectens]|uniref:nuclear protein MDM1 isoform X2 n=1 Tax=Protopterus annectens TaxID=7888 RepID=UPI001CF93ECD|nr:nuclear protein MDM1 isoform X2 [Protopterus annectens]
MPLRFKGVTEYKKNYGSWDSKQSERFVSPHKQKSRWAGLRSYQLGITKEPSFTSKKKVAYYTPQVSKSFQWEWDSEAEKNVDPPLRLDATLRADVPKLIKTHEATTNSQSVNQTIQTPVAPRDEKVPQLQSTSHNVSSLPQSPVKNNDKTAEVVLKEDGNLKPKKRNSRTTGNGLHRVLQKKAGLIHKPVKNLARSSEYDRQFVWKTPAKTSPLLSAEQIFNQHSKTIPPCKSKATTWQTTYEREFKGSPPPKGPRLRKHLEEKEMAMYEQENISPKKKAKKMKEKLSLDVPVRKELQENEQPDENHILKSQNRHSPGSPRKRHGKFRTEYKSNFLSPTNNVACIKDYLDIWEEVKEVKEKAREYKQRALGTHFSRDHLNQIISENNRLWEESDSSSDEEDKEDISHNIKALDLARNLKKRSAHPSKVKKLQSQTNAHSKNLQTSPSKENVGLSNTSTLPVKSKLAWSSSEPSEDVEQQDELKQKNYTDRRLEMERVAEKKVEVEDKLDNATEDENVHSDLSDSSSTMVLSSEGGRHPTPKLKTAGGVQRTHHDRTTPTIGGAVLVSPPKHKSPTPEVHRIHLSQEGSSPLRQSKCESSIKSNKVDGSTTLQRSPAAGIKTCDPLPIREEDWPATNTEVLGSDLKTTLLHLAVPKPKTTSQAQTSVHASSSRFWSPTCRIQGSLRDAEFQHNKNVIGPRLSFYRSSASQEITSNDDDDERLSQISARSAASSSLASSLLERAEKRRHFWKTT